MARMQTDGGVRESEVMHHSHLSKDIILFLLVYSYYYNEHLCSSLCDAEHTSEGAR